MNPAFLKKSLFPALTALAGFALMATSAFFTGLLPQEDAPLWLGINLTCWLAAVLSVAYYYATHPGVHSRWRIPSAIALFTLGVIPDMENYAGLTITTLSLIGLGLLVYGLLRWQPIHPLLATFHELLMRQQAIPPWQFVWLLYTLFLVAAFSLSWYCFSFLPALVDTVAQYVHSRIIAGGHFSSPSHPLKQFFPVWMSVSDGRFYSQYQPMHLLTLALGWLIGAPWLVDPVEGALSLVLIYAITRRIADEQTARLAAMLTLGCQFMLFISSEYMNHATSLLFLLLFVLGYMNTLDMPETATRARRAGWPLLAGLSLGAVVLTRPLTAVGITLPFIAYAVTRFCRAPRRYAFPFIIMASGIAACVAFQGWYNYEITGSALSFPYVKYQFSLVKSFGYLSNDERSFADYTLVEAHTIWHMLNGALFEWPVPSTLFVLITVLSPLKNRYERLFLAAPFSLLLLNMANHWKNYNFGPRYIYETAPFLIILSALGIMRLPGLLARAQLPTESARGLVSLLVSLLFAFSLVSRLPANIHKYAGNYLENRPAFYYALLAQAEKPALVFIEPLPQEQTYNNYNADLKYHWVAFTNPPRADAPVIFAYDRGLAEDRKLVDFYPARTAYMERSGHLYPFGSPDMPPAKTP